jgi:hypothetical protein
MGCCCSVDSAVLQAERTARNPKEPHHEWASHMLADIGSDVFAVPRDFPRMHVHLLDPDTIDEGDANDSHLTPALAKTSQFPSSLRERHHRILKSISSIASVCNEADTVGARIEAWIQNAFNSQEAPFAALMDQPDASPLVRLMQLDVGLVTQIVDHHANEPTAEDGNVAHNTTPKYHAACKTFRVLEYLVQGIVFYPVQRLAFLLWFPWSNRHTDVEWHSFVCTRANFPEHVYVVHRMLSKNYVEKDDVATDPQFEFEWDLVIAVKSSSGDFDDVQINVRRVTLLSTGDAVDTCCRSRSDSQLMNDRIAQLSQRSMDVFNVEVAQGKLAA